MVVFLRALQERGLRFAKFFHGKVPLIALVININILQNPTIYKMFALVQGVPNNTVKKPFAVVLRFSHSTETAAVYFLKHDLRTLLLITRFEPCIKR